MTPPLHDLNPAHVRTLQEVVRRGSFSRAAEDLHLSQPAMSLHIRQLEEKVGLALVAIDDRPGARSGRLASGMRKSPAG
jgi:DNA-binding transcriptional LysR family regulator